MLLQFTAWCKCHVSNCTCQFRHLDHCIGDVIAWFDYFRNSINNAFYYIWDALARHTTCMILGRLLMTNRGKTVFAFFILMPKSWFIYGFWARSSPVVWWFLGSFLASGVMVFGLVPRRSLCWSGVYLLGWVGGDGWWWGRQWCRDHPSHYIIYIYNIIITQAAERS